MQKLEGIIAVEMDTHKYLQQMTLIKQTCIRSNQFPFVNRSIDKVITPRTFLTNRFLKEAISMNRLAHNNQRKCYVSPEHERKNQYYDSSNVNCISDFVVAKPNLSNKIVTNIVILKDSEIKKSDARKLLIHSMRILCI